MYEPKLIYLLERGIAAFVIIVTLAICGYCMIRFMPPTFPFVTFFLAAILVIFVMYIIHRKWVEDVFH